MIKYKRVTCPVTLAGKEGLTDMLAGMAGKNRHIISIACTGIDGDFLRVYRDAEQIVDVDNALLTAEAPWLPMDLPLAEGQQCKVGEYVQADETDIQIVIGYTETG